MLRNKKQKRLFHSNETASFLVENSGIEPLTF